MYINLICLAALKQSQCKYHIRALVMVTSSKHSKQRNTWISWTWLSDKCLTETSDLTRGCWCVTIVCNPPFQSHLSLLCSQPWFKLQRYLTLHHKLVHLYCRLFHQYLQRVARARKCHFCFSIQWDLYVMGDFNAVLRSACRWLRRHQCSWSVAHEPHL